MGKKPEKYRFDVQGGGSQPYVIWLTFEPFTISCTCAAAYTNQPCKHRIALLKGDDPGFVRTPKNHLAILEEAKQAAEAMGVFKALEAYQEAKAEKQRLSKASDQEFKKYREVLIARFMCECDPPDEKKMQKSIKAVEKAFEKMVAAILNETPAHANFETLLSELNRIFIRHDEDVSELAQSAADGE